MRLRGIIAPFALSTGIFLWYVLGLRGGGNFDPAYLWIGLTLLSSTLVVAAQEERGEFFIILLFVASFLLLSWPVLRLGVFLGSDIYGEVFVARYTYDFGLTQVLMQKARYGNVLSVTILPSMISKVTGIPVAVVFATALTGVVAVVPILSYILIRRVTRSRRIAALSSLIFIFDYTFFNVFPALVREDVALLFLLLALFALYASQEHPRSEYALVFVLSVVGIVVSHYTVALFSIGVFVCLYLLDRLRNPVHRSISDVLMLFIPLMVAAWLMFATPTILDIVVGGLEWYSRVSNILGAHPYSSYLFSSPRGGEFSTIIIGVYRILIVAGVAIAVSTSKRANKQLQIFTLLGVAYFFLALPFVVLPIGRSVPLDRIWSFGLIFLSFFAATAVVRISSIASRLFGDYVGVHEVTRFVKIVAVALLISIFFVNHVIMSPSIYYAPGMKSDSPLRLTSDELFVNWAESKLDLSMLILGDTLATQLVKYSTVSVSGANIYTFRQFKDGPLTAAPGEYIIILEYTVQDNFVLERNPYVLEKSDSATSAFLNSTVVQRPSGRDEVHYSGLTFELYNEVAVNRIYNNGQDLLFSSTRIWTPLT